MDTRMELYNSETLKLVGTLMPRRHGIDRLLGAQSCSYDGCDVKSTFKWVPPNGNEQRYCGTTCHHVVKKSRFCGLTLGTAAIKAPFCSTHLKSRKLVTKANVEKQAKAASKTMAAPPSYRT